MNPRTPQRVVSAGVHVRAAACVHHAGARVTGAQAHAPVNVDTQGAARVTTSGDCCLPGWLSGGQLAGQGGHPGAILGHASSA